MARRLRKFAAEGLYFATFRAEEGRFLLRPGPLVNRVIGGVLARAVRLSGVRLHHAVVMSTHGHLVSTARDRQLADCMQYLLGNLSKKLNPLLDRRGHLWDRRYAHEPILDPAAAEERTAYLLSHGVKEGLVQRPEEWPGFNCVEQLLTGEERQFPFFEWTRRWRNGRLVEGGEEQYDERWAVMETLRLEPLPHQAGWTQERRAGWLRDLLDRIVEEGKQKFRRVLGVAKVLQQTPDHRPRKLKRSPQPWCHASTYALRAAYRAAYRAFADWFRQASARFRSGDLSAIFPPRSFRPHSWSTAGAG